MTKQSITLDITYYVIYNSIIVMLKMRFKKMTEYIELPTIGEILKEEFMEPYELSQNSLARAIFVPPNRIHQIIKGIRRVTADTDLRLTKYFGLTEGYFLRMQENLELRQAKRIIADELNNIQAIQG